MKNYLEKKEYQRNSSFILVAPTGTGKTTALIEYLRETKEQCIFVSPLNSLAKQVYEKGQGLFQLINCENKIESILGDIHYALLEGKSIIISLNTFIKYKNMFYKYNIYIDECHLITDYKEMMDTNGLTEDIRNNKFNKIVGLTATAFGLDKLLNLNMVKPKLKPVSLKNIELCIMKYFKLENIVATIIEIFKNKGKLVFLLNNTLALKQIKEELIVRGINVKLYISEQKEINIINEHFVENFDILLCSSALATGVSIKDDFYSVYVPQSFDSINLLAQYFSRNRNKNTYGCILKKYYINKNIDTNIVINQYCGRTGVNKTLTDNIYDVLSNISDCINIENLNYFLNENNEYNFIKGKTYNLETKLMGVQKFELLIPDQKIYFMNNHEPKFDKIKYKKLYRIYQLYDYVVFGNEKDDILEKYGNEFIENNGSFVLDRELFYDFCYKKVNKYLEDKGKEIAFKTNENSLDTNLIMKKFVDKEYNKKEFKEFCIKNFSIKEEVFKNKNTIDIFLSKIGMCLKRGKTGSILRKL